MRSIAFLVERSIVTSAPQRLSVLAASKTILASMTDSEMIERTCWLLLRISVDCTRASFTAAMSPATTARALLDFSLHSRSEGGVGRFAQRPRDRLHRPTTAKVEFTTDRVLSL
jgi:hypothetical protein